MSEKNEFEKREMTLEYIKELDEALILEGTEKYVSTGVIDEAKKDMLKKAWFVADKSSICIDYKVWKKWFGKKK